MIALMHTSSLQLESEQQQQQQLNGVNNKPNALIGGESVKQELAAQNSRLNEAYLQREETLRKLPTSLLLSLYLQEVRNGRVSPLRNGGDVDQEEDTGAGDGENEYAAVVDNNDDEDNESESDDADIQVADSLSNYLQKRSKTYLAKKESPFDQRSRDLRRQQAARWDIGFGKRAQGGIKPPKPFMDALYGKRSGIKHAHPKIAYGRKQQWDIQYGRK
jgi:hypothetical protein